MLSNENLLNAQNAYITQLQAENTELKAKLRKAADDVLTADSMRAAAANNYTKLQQECEELKKTVEGLRSAAAQHTTHDVTISQLRRHNMQLRGEIERLKQTSGYTGVPMAVQLDGETFQNNEDGLKAFASAVQRAERMEFKNTLDRYLEQFNILTRENHRLETHLRSAENALKEKDAELEALRAHCGERSERSVPQKPDFTPPPTRKVILTSCTPEEREEALKQMKAMEDHFTSFLDRMMKR